MVSYGTSSRVIGLCRASQSIKAERNGNGVTNFVRERKKTIQPEKVGKGATFFQIYNMRGSKNSIFLSEYGQNFLPCSQRGVKIFVTSF